MLWVHYTLAKNRKDPKKGIKQAENSHPKMKRWKYKTKERDSVVDARDKLQFDKSWIRLVALISQALSYFLFQQRETVDAT